MLEIYKEKFAKLRSDRNRVDWSDAICNRAPHKPFLLLAVIDQFAEGQITSNLIELNTDLGELFTSYWLRVMQSDQRTSIAYPFFHLSKERESFWHLCPRPGKEDYLKQALSNSSVADRIRSSVNRLQEVILGVTLDDELCVLLRIEESREALRRVLITTYFAPNVQEALVEQGALNVSAFRYSQELLEQAHTKETKESRFSEERQAAVRRQGFRRAVVTAYAHRCALCGIRMLTLEGHTVVDAAHIVPWSVSHNDHPQNGMALCRLCHWAFDEGLISIAANYTSLTSPQLTANQSMPGHMLTLSGRSILVPSDAALHPDLEALGWHRQHTFRK